MWIVLNTIIEKNQTLIFISNRMISSTINEKITSHKKEKARKSYRVRKDEEWFYAFSFDELFFSLIERANYTIPG